MFLLTAAGLLWVTVQYIGKLDETLKSNNKAIQELKTIAKVHDALIRQLQNRNK